MSEFLTACIRTVANEFTLIFFFFGFSQSHPHSHARTRLIGFIQFFEKRNQFLMKRVFGGIQ